MDNYFIKYGPYSLAYVKYKIVKLDKGYAIKVKPTWKRGRIFDSSTIGKYHTTYEEAEHALQYLFSKFKRDGYRLEWKEQAEKDGSILNSIQYEKWKRETR